MKRIFFPSFTFFVRSIVFVLLTTVLLTTVLLTTVLLTTVLLTFGLQTTGLCSAASPRSEIAEDRSSSWTDEKSNFQSAPKMNSRSNSKSDTDPKSETVRTTNASEQKDQQKDRKSANVAGPASDSQAFQKMNQSVEKQAQFPWYSRETKKLVFIPPPQDEPEKKTKPDQPKGTGLQKVLNVLIWSGLIVLLFAFSLLIGRLVYKKLTTRTESIEVEEKTDDRQRRREGLPIEAQKKIDDLDRQAEKAFHDGDLHTAVIFYFSWVLVELDKKKLIRLQKGKTNHEFLNVLLKYQKLAGIYQKIMDRFENTYYGAQAISNEEFLDIWNEKKNFQEEVDKTCIVRAAVVVSVKPTASTGKTFKMFLLATLTLTLLATSGCRYWSERYTSLYEPESINGISLFNSAVKSQGYRTTITRSTCYNPREFDVIVWFNSSRNPFARNAELQGDCYRWLHEKKGRVLILVPSWSYSSEVDFWTEMASVAPSEQQDWIRLQLHAAETQEGLKQVQFGLDSQEKLKNKKNKFETKSERPDKSRKSEKKKSGEKFDRAAPDNERRVRNKSENFRQKENKEKDFFDGLFENDKEIDINIEPEIDEEIADMDEEDRFKWFRFQPLKKIASGSKLTGKPEWIPKIEPKIPYRFIWRLETQSNMETLLFAGDNPLICRSKVGESDLYVLASPAFLLNYPLLKEDRQLLTFELIEAFNKKNRNVLMALGNVYFGEQKQSSSIPFYFTTSPTSVLFWHLVFLAVIITFWKIPILGRPREIQPENRADFAKHLAAYADLLNKTDARSWAIKQIKDFLKLNNNDGQK